MTAPVIPGGKGSSRWNEQKFLLGLWQFDKDIEANQRLTMEDELIGQRSIIGDIPDRPWISEEFGIGSSLRPNNPLLGTSMLGRYNQSKGNLNQTLNELEIASIR